MASTPLGIDRIPAFIAVAEAGGFTAAAARLGITKAALSLQVARLEAELGLTLFSRSTRRVSLTDAGERLHAECAPLLGGLQAALERAGRDNSALRGSLRITAPPDYLANSLAPFLAGFAAEHPQLHLDLVSHDAVLDLVQERIDLALRFGWLPDSSLRAHRLGEFDQLVVAAPAYLDHHEAPATPAALAAHRWVALSLLKSPLTWRFQHARHGEQTVRVKEALRANAPPVVHALVREGAGISVLARLTVEADLRSGRLRQLLPHWRLPRGGIYAVYPASRHVPPKVRLFIDALAAALRDGRVV